MRTHQSRRSAQDARVRSLLVRTQPTSNWADKMNFNAETLLADLDRCPHGRHGGDVCTNCPGQVSPGNPLLPPGKIIGTSLGRSFMIRVPRDRRDRHDPRAWYHPIDTPAEIHEYEDAIALAQARNIEDDLDG